MNNKSFKKEYKEELIKLREESKKFAQIHPAIAPMLGEVSNDPDTERLLEGVAYLNAIIQKKLHDEFPEILYELIDILYPHYLKPVPSISIIEFFPDNSLDSTININKSTNVEANAYNDLKCKFQTTWDIHLSPLKLINVIYENIGESNSELSLVFNLEKNSFASINLESIDFFISNDIGNSSIVSTLLNHYLEKIEVFENGKKIANLEKTSIQNLGFDLNYCLFPHESNTLSNYKLLQEYFLFPEKFMFFKLNNIDKLRNLIQTQNFIIKFSFNKFFKNIKIINNKSIRLSCVPVINIFRDNCEPIKIQSINSNFEITPSWKYKSDYRIYDIVEVIGIAFGKKDTIIYSAFNKFQKNQNKEHLYKVFRKKSSLKEDIEECYLEIFRRTDLSFSETLSITIDATNGTIPENLGLGDICIHTSNSPARSNFKNITLPSAMIESPIEDNNLWFLISHATTNILNINSVEKLKELLYFYIGEKSKNKSKVESNKKKINSLIKFNISASTYIHRGILLSGSKLEISLISDNFINLADMYLFLDVLHNFFSIYCAINNYVELEAYDIITGEKYICKPKIGMKNIV